MPEPAEPTRPGLVRYGAAVVGLNLAYMPLLVLLLPRRAAELFGAEAAGVVSWLMLAGAIAASLGNIAAGRFADWWIGRFGSRRGAIALGLAALLATYPALALAETVPALVLAVIAFQLALNLALSPAMAVLADHVPDARKGPVSGWLGAAVPLSALGTAGIGWALPAQGNSAFLVLAGLVLLLVLPLPLFWGLGRRAAVPAAAPSASAPAAPRAVDSRVWRLWAARLMVQLANCFLLFYLFLYLESLIAARPDWHGRDPSDTLADLSLIGAVCAVLGALACGRLARHAAPRGRLLAGAALAIAAGLFAIGSAPSPLAMLAGFALIQLALAGYLAIDMAWVAQLLSDHPRRGQVLGLINLSNTLPGVAAAVLTLQGLQHGGLGDTLELAYRLCALGALLAAALTLTLRGDPAK